MVIEEIIMANGTAVLISVILLICRLMVRHKPTIVDRVFTILVIIGISCAILETVSFLVDGKLNTALRVINIISNTLLYFGNATVSVLWTFYVDSQVNRNKKKSKALYIPMLVIWACLIISLIFNFFFGFLFTIDANNVYARQPAGYIFYVFLMASFVISIIMYIRSRVIHGQAQFFPIWMFLTPVILGCVIQAVWYGISSAWLGCAVGLLGIYVNLQSKQSHVDSLTNLYNRAYIEHKLIVARESKHYVYSGIMLDIDYFKSTNDKYGHSVGDKALIDASNILLSACDRQSLPFRFAGDEFVILVRVPATQKDQLEEKTLDVIKRVNGAADIFNVNANAPYKIVFSIGYAMYDLKENDDMFFHHMDDAMYMMKRKHHKEKSLQ